MLAKHENTLNLLAHFRRTTPHSIHKRKEPWTGGQAAGAESYTYVNSAAKLKEVTDVVMKLIAEGSSSLHSREKWL